MATEMTVALIGIAGVLVGGAVQYVATSIAERAKYKVETRTDAYRLFLDAAAKMTIFTGSIGNKPPPMMNEGERKTFIELQMLLNGARNRLALYASRPVLEKLALFTSRHAMLASDADCEAYIDFLEAMRADSFADNYDGFRRDVDSLMLRGMMKA
jgi:hypothetical protein